MDPEKHQPNRRTRTDAGGAAMTDGRDGRDGIDGGFRERERDTQVLVGDQSGRTFFPYVVNARVGSATNTSEPNGGEVGVRSSLAAILIMFIM